MDETQSAWLRIAAIITGGLLDLIRDAVAPDRCAAGSAGEIKLSIDGDHMTTAEIKVDKVVAGTQKRCAIHFDWRQVIGGSDDMISYRTGKSNRSAATRCVASTRQMPEMVVS